MIENNYSVDSTLEVKPSGNTFIEPGIRENLELIKVSYGLTPNNSEFLSFYFTNENGDKFSHTEWPVRLIKPFDSMSDQEKQSYLNAIDSQKRKVGQIVTAFIPREKYSFVANTFKEFAENIIRILDERSKDAKVRAKIVYNNKNFTTFPNSWKYTFIEPMSVNKEDSKIRLLNIDKVTRTVPDLESIPEQEVETAKPVEKEDLPF